MLSAFARIFVVAAISSLASCRGACTRTSPGASNDGAAPALPQLQPIELAKANERFQGIALDDRYVYVGAMFHGSRRVPKAGGPIEIVATSGDIGPAGSPDPRRAYDNGYGIEPSHTSEPGDTSFSVGASGVYRTTKDGKPTLIARSFPSGISRKTLVVDDSDVYWIEPAADSVFSVPRSGGPVRWVREAWVAIADDIALAGDRIYLVDIGGDLESSKKDGSDPRYLGNMSTELGANRNGIWITMEGSTLYIVSDATGFGGPSVVVIGEPMPDNTPQPTFESRVVKLDVSNVPGEPMPPHDADLIFAGGFAIEDLEKGSDVLERSVAYLDAVRDDLAKGRVPLSLTTEGAVDARVDAALTKTEAWLRARYGKDAKIMRPLPSSPQPGKDAAKSIRIGIARAEVAALFAPLK